MDDGHLVDAKPLNDISVKGVFRQELGDIDALADSIQRLGLLSPVVVTKAGQLLCGRRRVQAVTQLGWETVPCWVATNITDDQARTLAMWDDETLRKSWTPIEQAEAYAAWEAVYAAQAQARHQATQFGNTAAPAGADGGGDSPPPAGKTPSASKSRTKAAVKVTGTDSHQRLERIRELQAIARDDTADPFVQQDAIDALVELNEDGHVAARWERVKLHQALTELATTADSPTEPQDVRDAAVQQLDAVEAEESPKARLKAAKRALKTVGETRGSQPKPPPPPRDPHAREKQSARALVVALRRENGWWNRHDPKVFGQHADNEQWRFLVDYIDQATRFMETAEQERL
ncbi:MAG: ParB N-terminal domain-containing protein [Bifidobacteriaceae bacterium]|jgi:ParB family chromosome partitioning protein|nr:ParB N-terminal domain-containing protein [Bifidobacteriaceae bacterium]